MSSEFIRVFLMLGRLVRVFGAYLSLPQLDAGFGKRFTQTRQGGFECFTNNRVGRGKRSRRLIT